MSDLSVKLAALKGKKTTAEIVAALKVSRETFRRIERGQSVKLTTLRQISDYLQADRAAWIELLAAWLRLEAGKDAVDLWVEPREAGATNMYDAGEEQTARAMLLFRDLNAEERRQLILAMERPEVRRALTALNRLYEDLRK